MSDPGPARRRKHLFWRIYLHGLLLIVSVAAVSALLFHFFGDQPAWRRVGARVATLVSRELATEEPDRAALVQRLGELSFVLETEVAVYTNGGELLAAAGGAPPPALEPDAARELDRQRWFHTDGHALIAIPLPGRDAYLATGPWHRGDPVQLAAWLVALLAVLALMSVPLVRAIARPLERITETARRIGAGELGARTGVRRRGEVGVLAETLDEMAERLEQLIKGEKELLANVSHEIRTPLARIQVALELCADQGVTLDEIRNRLGGITGDVHELDALLDDVLAVSRIDLAAGGDDRGLATTRAQVPAAELLAEARQHFAASHPERELALALDGELPEIEVDRALIRRMLDNLLDNAVKYSEADRPIELAAAATSSELTIEVSDRGIGVAAADLERLFDPFFRSERSRSREAGGTGLGLALCRRIAEAHDGRISAAPRAGGGTCFTVVLPLLGT